MSPCLQRNAATNLFILWGLELRGSQCAKHDSCSIQSRKMIVHPVMVTPANTVHAARAQAEGHGVNEGAVEGVQTKGVVMDMLWMFVGVMLAMLIGGWVVYKKSA